MTVKLKRAAEFTLVNMKLIIFGNDALNDRLSASIKYRFFQQHIQFFGSMNMMQGKSLSFFSVINNQKTIKDSLLHQD